ncbi:hypothetical protein H6P81_012483 [Aristolochia fimbriata]|uniref:PROP1-like PPR domain-containing protein n=1 Tax=Aristolochia fimbriata TaxID=158543 RepID=A0AAV7EBW6_ARIFI|nr:hypothetical protein H6P81_012483 [Aristolochia fimbriata]
METNSSDVDASYKEEKDDSVTRDDRSELSDGSSSRIDVRALAMNLQPVKTVADVEEVLKDFGDLPLPVYSSVIRGFGKDKKLDSAFTLVEWLRVKRDSGGSLEGPNLYIYNSLLGVIKQSGQYELVDKVMKDMATDSIVPNVVTYNTLMAIYIEQGLAKKALDVLAEIQDKGLVPSAVSYSTALLAYRRLEDGEGALRLFVERREEYQKGELTKDPGEDWENEIVKLETFAVRICYQAKKWWAALEVYEDLLDKGPKPNNLSYELIVSHFNILLTAARKKGIWRWGVRLLNKMQDKGLKPGSREWNAVLVACSKASETSAAVQIFRRMVEEGEKPTIVSYGALLSALEKGKMYDEALRVWEHMCKVGIKPNLYAYTILVSVYIGQGQQEKVDEVIREMVSCGVEPTVVTFNAIISGCAKKSMGSAAFEWFHRMKVQNITPNEITYEMLIEALANDAKPRLAYEMYLRAYNEGLRLSAKAYDAVIQSARYYGASIDTTVLGPRPLELRKKTQTRKILSKFCELADVPRRDKPFDAKELYPS